MKYTHNAGSVEAAQRKAKLREKMTWRIGVESLDKLIRIHYKKDYYETYMLDLLRAIENEVVQRIAQQVLEAQVMGMMDSYPVMRRKTVLDILHERYEDDEDEDDDERKHQEPA